MNWGYTRGKSAINAGHTHYDDKKIIEKKNLKPVSWVLITVIGIVVVAIVFLIIFLINMNGTLAI